MKPKIICTLASLSLNIALHSQSLGNSEYMEGNAGYGNNYYSHNRRPTTNAYIANNEEMQVTVNGLLNIVADNYVAIFNIVQVADNAENADGLMNHRIIDFKKNLKTAGIDTNDIKVDMISFVPRYDYQVEQKLFSKTYNEIPAGFELQKNVSVRFKNSAKLDDIVSAAARAEIYDLVKVDYFIPNIQRSLDSLRLKCLLEFKSKVKSYELIGIRLDTLKKVMSDNFITTYPPTRYNTYQAFTRPSLQAAKKKSAPSVNEIQKSNSRYYSQVDYDQYDLVINPLITEPVVQVSYSLTVKYFLKEKEPQQKNNYYIITSTGDLKQVFAK
jgi:uncharacterized protein YggE